MRHIYHESAFDPAAVIGSWWEESAGAPVACENLAGDGTATCEVAVIGAGYTGLSTAYHLARDYGVQVRVLEAAAPGWGGSGRNGGFVGGGGSKLDAEVLARRYGLEETRRFLAWQTSSTRLVAEILQVENIDADKTGKLEIGLAHKARRMKGIRDHVAYMNKTFEAGYTLLDRAECAAQGLAGPEVHGGYGIPGHYGIHPLKYLRGLARAAQAHGVAVHDRAPVERWRKQAGVHVLSTPRGELRARQVVIATNGYTAENTSSALAGRLLPVLSNILVTRVLTRDEQLAQGWTTTDPVCDSRKLLHYVRLLPDGRFLFGGRGGWDASPLAKQRMRSQMEVDFRQMFPAWSQVEFTHFWNGFVCLSSDLVAHISNPGGDSSVWSALAWQGSGIAAGTAAGKLVAQLVTGNAGAKDIPLVMRGEPPRFPLPRLRTTYLRAAYGIYRFQDEYL